MEAQIFERIFALTGMPRSGTTYLCAVLHNPPQVITLSEASGQWKRLFKNYGRSIRVFEVFSEQRERILRGEKMATFEGTSGYQGEERVDTWNQKKVERALNAVPDFVLGMKNPAVFLELLEVFRDAGIKCVISVRHPVSILNSWVKKTLPRLKTGKSIKGTFAYGDAISYRSNSEDPVDRRIDLHNYFADLIVEHMFDPNVMIVRHEDWYTDQAQLERVARFLNIPHSGRLRPKAVPPDPPILSQAEQERILVGCKIAGEFGYPVEKGRLKPPRIKQQTS